MTPRQQMAIGFPCARAMDTLKERFRQTHRRSGKNANQFWSTILTVNK